MNNSVKDFVGEKMVKFILDVDSYVVDVPAGAVLEEWMDSKLNLQKLDLTKIEYSGGTRLSAFVKNCPNLTSLSVAPEHGNGETHLHPNTYFSDVVENLEEVTDLKSLYLVINWYHVSWDTLSRWIGNELEELTLLCMHEDPIKFDSIIFQFSETIKTIHLGHANLEDYSIL